MPTVSFNTPGTGRTTELSDPQLGQLVIDEDTGVEYEVVSLTPPRLEVAPQEREERSG